MAANASEGRGVNVLRARNVAGHEFRVFPGIHNDGAAVGQDAPDFLGAYFLGGVSGWLGQRCLIDAAALRGRVACQQSQP
jgi:hypothetical protein